MSIFDRIRYTIGYSAGLIVGIGYVIFIALFMLYFHINNNPSPHSP